MRVRVARIGKPIGLAGQVSLTVFTDEPARRLAAGSSLYDEQGDRRFEVTTLRRSGTRFVVGLAGVDDRDAAEELRGTELYAEAAAGESPDGPDEHYDRDLIGLPCRTPTGEELGEVVAVEHPPAHDLLVVRTPAGHEARVPFVSAIVVSIENGTIVIDPPGGLFDPNLEAGTR